MDARLERVLRLEELRRTQQSINRQAQELADAEARRTHEEDYGDYYVPKAMEDDR